MSFLPPGTEAGATNLTCPNCDSRIGILQLLRNISPETISPNTYTTCPQCSAWFFPENALLQTLRNIQSTGKSFFRFPISLGSGIGTNVTWVNVSETRETQLNNLYEDYEIEAVYLQNAERSDVGEDERLPIETINGFYHRATLADILLVEVSSIGSKNTVVRANLREGREDTETIEVGDKIKIVYEQALTLRSATNPPWIDLLRGAAESIRNKNTTAAVPLIVSAVDNLLYRQIYLYYRLDGNNHDNAHELIVDKYGNDRGDLYREDFAKNALDNISGVRLTNGPPHKEWRTFQDEILETRRKIVHPQRDPVQKIDRETAIDWYNTTFRLILGMFDLVWFE